MIKKLVFPLILLCMLGACEQQSEYEQWVETELEKEARHDTLFLGYRLGMKKQEFFKHSWQLNQDHVVKGGAQVVYKFDDLGPTAQMVFYPEFSNNEIYKMPVEISYESWAPWNPELSADSLLIDLIDLYEHTYGGGFLKMKLPDISKTAWVKVDGNRRIAIYPADTRKIRVEFLDLSVQKKVGQQ